MLALAHLLEDVVEVEAGGGQDQLVQVGLVAVVAADRHVGEAGAKLEAFDHPGKNMARSRGSRDRAVKAQLGREIICFIQCLMVGQLTKFTVNQRVGLGGV